MNLRRGRHGDDGTSLLIVLIIITSVSLVMGTIIAQADTAVRTSVTLRDQSSDNYSADAGTQAVLAGLKSSGINCANPANPTGVQLGTTASPFYVPTATQQGPINAYAKCVPDSLVGMSTSSPPPVTSSVTVTPGPVTSTSTALGAGDPTLPSYAMLTVGNGTNDYGFTMSNSAGNKTVCIENGSVGSNASVSASGSGQVLGVRLAGTGTASDCSTGTGVSASGSRLIVTAASTCPGAPSAFQPTACTPSSPQITTPAAPTLSSPIAADDPAPQCKTTGGTTYAAFVPGRYTTAAALNAPCGASGTILEWLSPGTYYFDFAGTTVWNWPTTVIGGTPIDNTGTAVSGLDPTKASTLTKLSGAAAPPNACADPASSTGVQGVQLVFGGVSVMHANSGNSASGQICASSSTSSPPLAIYGLAAAQTIARSGGGSSTIPAESMCSATGCGTNTLIQTDVSGHAEIYIKGYVYAPNAQVILTLKNSPGQVFNWGIVLRDFQLTINGSSPTQAFVQLPKPNTGVGVVTTTSTPPPYPTTTVTTPAPFSVYTIRYINVWTCTVASLTSSGLTQCPTTGNPNIQARVLTDASGVPQKVLSWAHIR